MYSIRGQDTILDRMTGIFVFHAHASLELNVHRARHIGQSDARCMEVQMHLSPHHVRETTKYSEGRLINHGRWCIAWSICTQLRVTTCPKDSFSSQEIDWVSWRRHQWWTYEKATRRPHHKCTRLRNRWLKWVFESTGLTSAATSVVSIVSSLRPRICAIAYGPHAPGPT